MLVQSATREKDGKQSLGEENDKRGKWISHVQICYMHACKMMRCMLNN